MIEITYMYAGFLVQYSNYKSGLLMFIVFNSFDACLVFNNQKCVNDVSESELDIG